MGSRSVVVDRERAARYGRAASRWAQLLVTGRAAPGLRVFYGCGTGFPGRASPSPGGPPSSRSSRGDGPTARPISLSCISGRRTSRVTYGRSSGSRSDEARGSWSTRTVSPIRVGPAIALGAQRAAAPPRARSRPCRLPERVQQALVGPLPRRAGGILGDSPQRCRRRVLHARPTPTGGPVVLLGGDQTQEYRLELALETFRYVLDAHPDARLLVSGRIVSDPKPTLRRLGLESAVELTGRYAQLEAPAIFRGAHILLHTKVNDPCPTAVIEAMACGVPVAYAASGGTVELVGDDAGVGVPHPDGYDQDEPPAAEDLARAVSSVLSHREQFAAGARRRAVERFALSSWLDRHAAIFDKLIGVGGLQG